MTTTGSTIAARVVLADAHEAALFGMGAALEADGMDVVAAVMNGPDAVAAAVRTRPDAALIDVALPGGGGVAAACLIAERAPEVAVVLIAAEASDTELLAGLRAGARGYLLKDTDPDRLSHALRGAIAGEAAIPRALVLRLAAEYRRLERQAATVLGLGDRGLSRREVEVLTLLADGRSTREVAAELGIADVTVRRHVSSAAAKLGVPGRAAAVRHLRDSG